MYLFKLFLALTVSNKDQNHGSYQSLDYYYNQKQACIIFEGSTSQCMTVFPRVYTKTFTQKEGLNINHQHVIYSHVIAEDPECQNSK